MLVVNGSHDEDTNSQCGTLTGQYSFPLLKDISNFLNGKNPSDQLKSCSIGYICYRQRLQKPETMCPNASSVRGCGISEKWGLNVMTGFNTYEIG